MKMHEEICVHYTRCIPPAVGGTNGGKRNLATEWQ